MGVTCFYILIFSTLLGFPSAEGDLKVGGDCSGVNADKCATGSTCDHGQCVCTAPLVPDPATRLCNSAPAHPHGNSQHTSPAKTTTTQATTTRTPCLLNQTPNSCAANYECIGGTCQCPKEQYYVDNSKGSENCTKRKFAGAPCDKDIQNCVQNASCADNGTCVCNKEYFKSSQNNYPYCLLKSKVGGACNSEDECWDGAKCSSSEHKCQCDPESQFVREGQCFQRLGVDKVCRSEIQNECIKNAKCVSNLCQCSEGYFKKDDTCSPTVDFRGTCDNANPDKFNQCESNTVCGPENNCTCESVDDFFNGEKCEKRFLASFPCPYLPGDQSRIDLLRQCVDNAACDHDTRICTCDDDHFLRAGYCIPRIDEGKMCDSWSGYHNQCKDNLECLYGMCLPEDIKIG